MISELPHQKSNNLHMQNQKSQISCAVTAQLISAFGFATWIVQSLFFLNLKFQAFSYFLWLYSLVFVGHGRTPRLLVFSCEGSSNGYTILCTCVCSANARVTASAFLPYMRMKQGETHISATYVAPRGKTNVVSEQARHKPACTSTEKS